MVQINSCSNCPLLLLPAPSPDVDRSLLHSVSYQTIVSGYFEHSKNIFLGLCIVVYAVAITLILVTVHHNLFDKENIHVMKVELRSVKRSSV